ncbi:MAG: SUMF1/EgtB/PvdO family nonheme iron enzyme [Fibrobacterota bacterium]
MRYISFFFMTAILAAGPLRSECMLKASGDTTAAVGDTVFFDAAYEGEIDSFYWDFDADGIFDNGSVSSEAFYVYNRPGLYYTVVKAKSGLCGKLDDVRLVEILSGVPEIKFEKRRFSGIINRKIILRADVKDTLGTSLVFEWDYENDGTFDSRSDDSAYAEAVYEYPGLYFAVLKVTDEDSNTAAGICSVFVSDGGPVPLMGPTVKMAAGDTLLLECSAIDSAGVIVSYEWDINGDGVFERKMNGPISFPVVFEKEGTYELFQKVTDDDGNTAIGKKTVFVTRDKLSEASGRLSLPKGRVSLYGMGKEFITAVRDYGVAGNPEKSDSYRGVATTYFSVDLNKDSTSVDSVEILVCPDDMAAVPGGKFCIDLYEYPNKKDSFPLTGIDYYKAKELCAAKGKRLCSAEEWQTACSGPEKSDYPYGEEYTASARTGCNTEGSADEKPVPSGSYPECRSGFGIYDLCGNVSEWTSSFIGDSGEKEHAVLMGGDWQSSVDCGFRGYAYAKKGYVSVGFRCCK